MFKNLLQLAANIPAGLVGGAMFVFSLFVLQLGVPLSFIVALSGYVISGTWLFSSPAPAPTAAPPVSAPSIPAFEAAARELADLAVLAERIEEYDAHDHARAVCADAEEMLTALTAFPGDARTAQQFSAYYLEPAGKMIRKYLEIAAQSGAAGQLEQAESLLRRIRLAFEKQRDHIRHEGHLYLDLDIAALEQAIEPDSIG